MSLLSRLLRLRGSDREALHPLWHRIVAIAREPQWYAQCGVEDTLAGRFDAITLVLSLVLLRIERVPALIPSAALLTELFVSDMDGQLRESGVGDLVVGKRIGRQMSVLGGRLGAYRDGLAAQDDSILCQALERNVSMNEGADLAALVQAARQLAGQLKSLSDEALLAGEIPR